MSKAIPLQYGHYYHIYNRGNNREDLFKEERNYHYFLKLYARYVDSVADTYVYCLLINHFHFLVRIKTVDQDSSSAVLKPSHQFGNLYNAYTKAINKAYRRTGRLFEPHFERIEVTTEGYLIRLVTYIHRNPQKHRLITDFRKWPYSSYQSLLSTKPTRLQREEVLAWFGGSAQFEAAHHTPSAPSAQRSRISTT